MESLLRRYPELSECRQDIEKALDILIKTAKSHGKILLCGNGGSCADCDHITGELMKGFMLKRKLSEKDRLSLAKAGGEHFADFLQYGIPAINLCAQNAVNTAFVNDVSAEAVYAQMMYAYAEENDCAVCISTSGNSANVVNAAIAAKAKSIPVISLTGKDGGRLNDFSDVVIKVPETETYKVQELHLPVYHFLCATLESEMFGD